MSLLTGTGLRGGYGGPDILHGCDIAADRGEITVIVGPNGAGKSTAMRALFGMAVLSEGAVHLDGREITRLPPPERVRAGMAFVPQSHNVFPSMTVEENLEMGAFLRRDRIGARNGTRVHPVPGFLPRSAARLPESCPAVSASKWLSAGR